MTTANQHAFDATRRAMPEPIVSERLVLRRPLPKDAETLQRLANNHKIYEMLARLPHPYTLEHATDFIDNLCRTDHEHAYAITRDEAVVGIVSFQFTTHDEKPVIELGYWVGEPYWGKGYATEAAAAIIDAIISLTPNAPLFARAKAKNTMSCNVLEKVGFTPNFQAKNDCGQHKAQLIQYFEWEGANDERS